MSTRRLREFALHLLALNSLAVAYPVLEILAGRPEFFLAHRAGSAELILFTAIVSLLIPLLAILPVLGVAGTRWQALPELLMAAEIAMLSGAMALLWIRTWTWLPGIAAIGKAVATGITITACRYAFRSVRTFLTFLLPSVLVVPFVFFLNPSIYRIASGEAGNQSPSLKIHSAVPVIWIVWDEFPVFPLMDSAGNLDSTRFPNYGRLAGYSTWYRNAITVSDETTYSVPAMLTGRYPARGGNCFLRPRPVF